MTWAINDSLRDGFCSRDSISKALEPYTSLNPNLYPEELVDMM
jgi:hypothetical protein